jgi:glycosyltransferase involved in cell wall biosynthesis
MLHLARAVAAEHKVDVVALGAPPAPETSERFTLTHLPGDWSKLATAVRATREPFPPAQIRSRAIARHLRSNRWDVIQAHELPMLRYARGHAPCILDTADVLTGVKRTLAATDSRLAMRPWWWFEAVKARHFETTTVRAATVVTVPADDDAAIFERWGARRVAVVRNGVDVATIAHAPPAAGPHIVYVGYFAWRPNVEAALELTGEVMPRIRTRVPAATLSLVGALAPRNLAGRVRRAGPSVQLTGAVADVVPHLRRARVTVMPLRAGGGTRIKVLEALAAGVPVVATPFAVSGIDVRDGVHALIAESATDLAAAAVTVIEDDALARRLSNTGRELVEARYGWPAVARPLVELHHELAEAARRR